ncbi:MAG: ribbon-helix-helix domain-containing protein [Polyangiales bacterium]
MRPTLRPRVHLTPHQNNQLRHLAIDLDRTLGALLSEAVNLLLRYYDRGGSPTMGSGNVLEADRGVR